LARKARGIIRALSPLYTAIGVRSWLARQRKIERKVPASRFDPL